MHAMRLTTQGTQVVKGFQLYPVERLERHCISPEGTLRLLGSELFAEMPYIDANGAALVISIFIPAKQLQRRTDVG
jgi:hypothetical protein